MTFHDFIKDSDGWTLRQADVLFSNPYLEIHRTTVTSPTRSKPFAWTVCHRKAAVVVAPLTADGKLVLVRQERVPIRQTIWEFPAGQIDHATDQDINAVRLTGLRELEEEAGYELGPDGDVVMMGYFFPSAGFTDEHSHLMLARGVVLSPTGAKPEDSEAITECKAFTPLEIREMIASGEIRDANTLSAYARLVALQLLPQ